MQVIAFNTNGQCKPCLTDTLAINTGYNHAAGSYYNTGSQDEYWRITNAPSNYTIPVCAVSWGEWASGWWTLGATTCKIGISTGLADGNTPCSQHCSFDDNPYTFERDFCVNTDSGNILAPIVMGTLDIKYCGDLKVKEITLFGPGGIYYFSGAICEDQNSCPFFLNVPNIPFVTGNFTLRFKIANDWNCIGFPIPSTNKTQSPMSLELTGNVTCAIREIFTDNQHYGKNTALCAPAYPPSPEFTLLGDDTCAFPHPSGSTFTITPFYNVAGQNTYTITGTSSPTIATTGTAIGSFSAPIGSYTITSTDASGCTFTKILNIHQNPSLTLTPAFQCIPPGSFANITANATTASPFLFSINGGPFLSNNIFNQSQGFYTVTVQDSNGCRMDVTAIIGNQFLAFLESQFQSSAPCHPDMLVASIWPTVSPITYSFNGGPPSPLNTYNTFTTGPGIYTVVATDAFGCTASSTMIVHPHPLLTVAVSACSGPAPGTVTITANAFGVPGPFSYQLNYGSPQASNVFVGPFNGTYTVTVTDMNGCTREAIVTTPPMLVTCCNPVLLTAPGAEYFNGWPSPTLTTSLPPLPFVGTNTFGYDNVNINIIIDGILTVNANSTLYFRNCPNILFGPNAEIQVENNGTIRIENSILRAACDTKWRGITATNGSQTVKLTKSSEIHDMFNGVEIIGDPLTNAALLQCEEVSFIDDDFGIILRNTQVGYAGYVRSNTFISTPNMLGPVLRTRRGVSIFNCRQVEIGGLYPNTAERGNLFKNLDNGIFVSANIPSPGPIFGSNIRIYNNRFEDITGGKQINDAIQTLTDNVYGSDIGCAIYARNFSPSWPQANIFLIVDNFVSTNPFPPYHILRCDKGIVTSNVGMDVANTRIDFTPAGILSTFIDSREFNIRNNFMRFVSNGITLSGFNASFSRIQNNEIEIYTLAPLINGSGAFYNPVAISLTQSASNTTFSKSFFIHNNRITFGSESGTGIDLLSTGKLIDVHDNTIQNICNNTGGVPFTNVPEFRGIQLTNTYLNDVKFNTITGNNLTRNYYGSNSGIKLNNSTRTQLHCNNIKSIKYGFRATSDCSTSPTSVIGNQFNDHIFAMLFLHLGSEGTFGNSIGSPAMGSTAGYDPDNKFGTSSYPLGYRLYKNSLCSSPAPELYYTSPLTLTNTQSGGNNLACRYDVLTSGTPSNKPNCNILPHFKTVAPIANFTPEELQHLIDVANGTIDYTEFEPGTRWMDEQNLYEQLSEDTVLRYSEPALDSFYNSRYFTASENILQTDREIQLMLDTLSLLDPVLFNQHLQAARTENANIVSTDQETLNEQMINEVYLKVMELGVDSINVDDDSLIQTFATGCPFVIGTATYKARQLYSLYNPNIQYDDIVVCNANGLYKGKSSLDMQDDFLDELNNNATEKILTGEGIKIHPNPATENIIITYDLNDEQSGMLIIFDMVGRERKRIFLDSRVSTVQTSIKDLEPSLYSYKYIIDGKSYDAGKLIIKN